MTASFTMHLKALARAALRGRHGALAPGEFVAPDWDLYAMDIRRPFETIESEQRETRIVHAALEALCRRGILPAPDYDRDRYAAFRKQVQAAFDIPWTAITPRMQRLIYAINAIHRPDTMIAAGVFCGNTFVSNAGAAVGAGAVYAARALIGLEIDPAEAARAERNVRTVDPTGVARILAADAIAFCRDYPDPIDLLYLDADDEGGRGKTIYLTIAEAAWSRLRPGALLLAHNSVNDARELRTYLEFVRDPSHCRESLNMVIDGEGLEVSIKADEPAGP
ncbi:MAG: class I SAM-dependent methyltransferase [Burkholderiales bacterium]